MRIGFCTAPPSRVVIPLPTISETSLCVSCFKAYKKTGGPLPGHICNLCLECCKCSLCSKCHRVIPYVLCKACERCLSCCQCYSCLECNTVYRTVNDLCKYCGKGKACLCCPHTTANVRISGEGDTLRARHPINLSRYLPTDPKFLTHHPSPRLCSAEIEVCGFRNFTHIRQEAIQAVMKAWSISAVGDGTLPATGVEFNTHPAGGDFWVNQISDLMRECQYAGVWVTGSAGCHIHVDCRDYNYEQLAKLLLLCSAIEPTFFNMVSKARRENSYCVMWCQHYGKMIHEISGKAYDNPRSQLVALRDVILKGIYGFAGRKEIYAIKTTKTHKNRYRALNVHSYMFRGTIEFRIPEGSIYPDTIINWGRLLTILVDFAKATPMSDIQALVQPMTSFIMTSLTETEAQRNIYRQVTTKASLDVLFSLPLPTDLKEWITTRIRLMRLLMIPFSEESPEVIFPGAVSSVLPKENNDSDEDDVCNDCGERACICVYDVL